MTPIKIQTQHPYMSIPRATPVNGAMQFDSTQLPYRVMLCIYSITLYISLAMYMHGTPKVSCNAPTG